jgi:Conserved TM helix/Mechanosensitive ion channel
MTFQPVVSALVKIITGILNFLPTLVNGLIILILGYLISVLVRWIVRFVIRKSGLEQLTDRVGVTGVLRRLGIHIALSEIIAQIVFFFLLLSFVTSAVSLMGLTTIADLLQSVLRLIPRAISATIIVIFGSMLAHFLGNTVTSVAESVNISYGRALGKIIEYAIVAFVIVLAVSTVGVDTTILTTSLTLIVAAVGLAISLTFAFGSRDSARNVIAGFYVRQRFQPGQQLTFDTYNGTVRSTSGAYTVLEVIRDTGERSTISLPNALLLERAIFSQEITPESNQPQSEEGTS